MSVNAGIIYDAYTGQPLEPQSINDAPAAKACASGNEAEQVSPEPGLLQFGEFVYSIFKPTDTVCFMTLPGAKHEFILAQDAIKQECYNRLKALNADQNIYIGMNAYNPELIGQPVGRTKENVVAVRTLFIDVDKNGPDCKDKILSSKDVPKPSAIWESSPDKFQFAWSVEDMPKPDAEVLLKALSSEFGGDKAAAEVARVLRVPGFKNQKYADAPEVRLISITGKTYNRSEFNISVKADSPKLPATVTGDKIPYGSHDSELTRIAGKLRYDGIEENSIADALIEVCEKRCENYGSDYKDMCRKIAHSIGKKPIGQDCTVYVGGVPAGTATRSVPTVGTIGEGSGTFNNPAPEAWYPENIDTTDSASRPEFPRWIFKGTSLFDGLVDPAVQTSSKYPELIFMPAVQLMLNYLSGRVRLKCQELDLNVYLGAISPYGKYFKIFKRRTRS